MAEGTIKKENEVIQIPIGKYLGNIKKNPWIVFTVLLSLICIFLLVLVAKGGGGISGFMVSEETATKNLLDFIKAQNNGEATLVSVEQQGGLYSAVVKYQGQDIPVFITLDGKFLVSDPIPLVSGSIEPAKPKAPVNVDLGDAPVQGDPNASITIVEFSDYQCPFCGKFFNDAYAQIKSEYVSTGKAKIVFKDFPLEFHPEAQKAAESARCVRDQLGDAGYWKMHDLIFKNQATLSVENEKKWARTLSVSAATFDTCLDSGKHAESVKKDLAYGKTLGVTGTPSFFINGKQIEGAQPFSAFKALIDAELTG